MFENVFRIRGRHVLSYAFDMSRAMRPIICFASRVECISSWMSCNELAVLLCLRKRFWRESKISFFWKNHLSLESIIFSCIFAMVFISDIDLYDLISILFFSGLSIGMIMECFKFFGISPDDHILLYTLIIELKADIGRLWINLYGIPSGPGAKLVHFDNTLLISAN